MEYYKQFANRPGYGFKTCAGATLTIQNQVESIQSMLNRATQGFPIQRMNVEYGMDENVQPIVHDLTDYDSIKHEIEYYKTKAASQKQKTEEVDEEKTE